MTKFFFKFKKPYFLGHFLNFRGKVIPKSGSVMHNLEWVSTTMTKFRKKLMIQFQEKSQTDNRTEGWREPISQDHSGYHQGSNKYNWSRMAFKSQRYRAKCQSNQKLLHRSEHVKISSISEFILTIQQILRSQDLNGHVHFDHTHPKTFEISFSFLEFAPTFKSQFIP